MERTEETDWKPNEELLTMLMDMGISKIAAEHALFYTGNNSAEAAACYVFDNFENDDLPSVPVTTPKKTKPSNTDVVEADAVDSDGEETPDTKSLTSDSFKMVFIVNTSLNMGIGKIAAQVAHASLGLYRTLIEYHTMEQAVDKWIENGEKKVVLKGDNHVHLQELQRQAEFINVHSYLVHDAGRTQIPANSVTVLALFGEERIVNNLSGTLNLL